MDVPKRGNVALDWVNTPYQGKTKQAIVMIVCDCGSISYSRHIRELAI